MNVFTLGLFSDGSIKNWTKSQFGSLKLNSPELEELSILSNCENSQNLNSIFFLPISLPKLATLKIVHRVEFSSPDRPGINYFNQLTLILCGSPALTWIEISYENSAALEDLLRVLSSIPQFPSLTTISIHHRQPFDPVTIDAVDLGHLAKIQAPHLKQLHLSFGFEVEMDGSEMKAVFQEMLNQFPNLTLLRIEGNFECSINPGPRIVIDFPELAQLEVLELGRYWELKSPVSEGLEENPNDRRGNPFEPDTDLIIFLNFCGPMPRLKSINLLVMYQFEALCFPELPALEEFLVYSQWTNSVPMCFQKKGVETSENSIAESHQQTTFSVKKLGYQDGFKNYELMTQILSHFPTLTHIYLPLSGVRFLQDFAKLPSFKHLILKVIDQE